MKLYRFSPINTETALLEAIQHVHVSGHKLSYNSFGKYLDKSGNIGIFCHYEDEYEFLTKLRKQLTDEAMNFNNKYFKLKQPITIPQIDDIPGATYEYLYIRQPDPYRYQVGDIDLCVDRLEYKQLKQLVMNGDTKSARTYEGKSDLDMIELFDADMDVLAYVVDHKMSEVVS